MTELAPENFADGAAVHRNAIYQLADFLLTRCPDRYDALLDHRVEAVKESFERFVSANSNRTADEAQGYRLTDALAHNYTLAQCSALLAFAHEVTRVKEEVRSPALDALVEAMWHRLRNTYELFFGVPWP